MLLSGLVAGTLLVACGSAPGLTIVSSAPPTLTTAAPPATTETTVDVSVDQTPTTRVERPPTTTTTILTAESLAEGSYLVAHAPQQVEVYEGPRLAAPSRTLDASTILGSPRVFLVETGPVDGWVEVLLPIRPNGSTGWVRASDLDLWVLDSKIVVDLSDRSLRLHLGGELALETEVAIGSPQNPTPVGDYFVTDVVELSDPSGPWGPFALGLSAFSDTITEFNGGDGIIGIHGTNRPNSIGEPVSLGCVRVPNEIATQLAGLVRLGTPVDIQT